jgi:hypothetical protein
MMDKQAWLDFITLVVNNPILILGLVVIAGLCFGLGWWFRHHTAEGTIRELNTRIEGLLVTNNQHVEALRERVATVERLLAHAQQEQGRVSRELESLQAENAMHVSTIETLKAASLPAPHGAQVTLLATGTSEMAITIRGISVANAEVGQALSRIAMEARNLTVGSPESGRPTLTSDPSRKPRPDHG